MISSGVLEPQPLVANSILYVSSASQLMPDMSLRPTFGSNNIPAPSEAMFSERPPLSIIPSLILPTTQPTHLLPIAPLLPIVNTDSLIERPVQIHTIVSPLEKLPEEKQIEILTQLEYYFSPINLSRDQFMINNMDGEQYILISCLANFPKIRSGLNEMTEAARIEYITQLLKGSKQLELDASECKVRRIPHESSNKPRDTLMLRGIEPGTTEKEIVSLFEHSDCHSCIDCKQAKGDCWYVSFSSEKDAMDAYQLIMKSNILLKGKSLNARIKQRLIEPTFSTQSTMQTNLTSPEQSRPESISQPEAVSQNLPPQKFASLNSRTPLPSSLPISTYSVQSRDSTMTPRSETFQRSVSSDSRSLAIIPHPQTLSAFVPAPVPTPIVPPGAIAQIRAPGQAMPQRYYQAFHHPGQIHILSHQQGITLVPAQTANPYTGMWPTQQLAFFDPASGHIVHMPTMQQPQQIIFQDMSRFPIQNRIQRPTVLIAQQPLQNAATASLQPSSSSTFQPPQRPQILRETSTSQPSITVPLSQMMQPPPQPEPPRPVQQASQTPRKYGVAQVRYSGRQSSVEEGTSLNVRMPPSLMADIGQNNNSVITNRSQVESGNMWQGGQLQPHHQQPQHQHSQTMSDHRSSDDHQQIAQNWTHHVEPSHMFQHPPPQLPHNIQHNAPPPHNPQHNQLVPNSQYSVPQHKVPTQNTQLNMQTQNTQHNVQIHNTHHTIQSHNPQHIVQPLNIQHNTQSHNLQHNVQAHVQLNVQTTNSSHGVQNNSQQWKNPSNASSVNNRDDHLPQRNARPKRMGRNNELIPNLTNRSKLTSNVVNQFDLESNSFPPLKHSEISVMNNSMTMSVSVEENVPLSRLSVSTDQSEASINNPLKTQIDVEIVSISNDGRLNENQLRPSYAQITQRGKDAPVNQSPEDQLVLLNDVDHLPSSETEVDAVVLPKDPTPFNCHVVENPHDSRKVFYDGGYNQNRRGGFGVPRGRGGKAYYNTSRVNNY